MPLYQYKCNACDHDFTSVRKVDDRHQPTNEPCPSCKAEGTVVYLISAPNVMYSGQGSLKTTDNFNDRMKEIKKNLPERYKGNINAVIR